MKGIRGSCKKEGEYYLCFGWYYRIVPEVAKKANCMASAVEAGVESVPTKGSGFVDLYIRFKSFELEWWLIWVASLDDLLFTSIVVVWVVTCMYSELSVLPFLVSKLCLFSQCYMSTLDAIYHQLSNNTVFLTYTIVFLCIFSLTWYLVNGWCLVHVSWWLALQSKEEKLDQAGEKL